MRKVIIYDNDGEIIDFENVGSLESLPIESINDDILIIKIRRSFHVNFYRFPNIEKLIEVIKEYGDFNKVLLDFNEIVVDERGVNELAEALNKKCFYINFDMMNNNDIKFTIPHSLYSHINYILNDDFLSARNYLDISNKNYKIFLKPHKLVFFSNNINHVRIDIFNILKSTNNLTNNIWSFNSNSVQYYSHIKHDLNKFLEENKDILPHSYDNYNLNDELTFSLAPQYLAYFEIFTESYYFNQILEYEKFCPVTEKMFKPIITYLPFIVFASPNLKQSLENIGLTFESPMYGFYDITNKTSIKLGLEHVKRQSTMTIKELHELYYQHVDEFTRNSRIFLDYFIDNRKNFIHLLNNSN